MFEGLKCSNMFVFQRQYLIEIRTINLNLSPHLGKVCSCGVEMLAKLKCRNKFGIWYEYTAVIFGEHFGFILWNIGIFAKMLDKLQLAKFVVLGKKWLQYHLFKELEHCLNSTSFSIFLFCLNNTRIILHFCYLL